MKLVVAIPILLAQGVSAARVTASTQDANQETLDQFDDPVPMGQTGGWTLQYGGVTGLFVTVTRVSDGFLLLNESWDQKQIGITVTP